MARACRPASATLDTLPVVQAFDVELLRHQVLYSLQTGGDGGYSNALLRIDPPPLSLSQVLDGVGDHALVGILEQASGVLGRRVAPPGTVCAGREPMLYLLAIVLPPLAMLLCGKPFQAIICLVLQVTLLGWIPAAIWALLVVNGHNADKRTDRLIRRWRKTARLSARA